MQGASVALGVTSAAALASDHKVASLADAIKAMKDEEAAQQLRQTAFSAKIDAERASTDAKISTLETNMQEAVFSIQRQTAAAAAAAAAATQRIEDVASNLSAAAAAAAAATAAQQTKTDAQFASVLGMLAKLTGTTAPVFEAPVAPRDDTITPSVATAVPPASEPAASSSASGTDAASVAILAVVPVPATTVPITTAPTVPTTDIIRLVKSPFVAGALPAARRKADRGTAREDDPDVDAPVPTAEKRRESARSTSDEEAAAESEAFHKKRLLDYEYDAEASAEEVLAPL